jgi:hypothetical protein
MEIEYVAQGAIYILINACMPGLVKIGYSTQSPEERAKKLSESTGVPTPYLVAWHEDVNHCEEIERSVHTRLEKYRFNRNREFFAIPLKDAIQTVTEIANEFREQERLAKETVEIEKRRREEDKKRAEQDRCRSDVEQQQMSGRTQKEAQRPVWTVRHQRFDETKRSVPFRSVERLFVQCPNCRQQYTVTFRRYEDRSCCPHCLCVHEVQIEW